MENLKTVLDNLTKHDMHVHVIDNETKLPVHVINYQTHFIMKGSEIVHVGNPETIEIFAMRLK